MMFEINALSPDIPELFDYRKTSPNRRKTSDNYLIGFESSEPGKYSAEGRGLGLNVGDTLYFSLKGSDSLCLPLLIERVTYLIEPANQWRAELSSESFQDVSIHKWQVKCNACGTVYPLEFVANSNDDQDACVVHAETRLKVLGWGLSGDIHTCPNCLGNL